MTSLQSESVAPQSDRATERSRKLNATSYVVLGMLCHGPATSYDLKQRIAYTIGNFWAFAHSQIYDEPVRLVADGLVTETVEQGGRRKRTYSITRAGRTALRDWLASNTHEQTEIRDLGLLKLFFAAFGDKEDLLRLARDRYESHRARADSYIEQYERIVDAADPWQVKTLELGMRYERTVEQFWADFIAELEGTDQPDAK
ncbi:MAG TPA: PadR family transcriptional regulator [Actinophytocola sp.]|uniref:PadR family transcriptional regulator n=1 Tax=Actinophytocola sp. TaxID=1872138 RepID=UPI002DBC0A36|nr:PadR family transcriptional regulator [Actinophytocola sp.]HEU5475413.1 PadR family transcriptional regulator [Actinophytocola sp.]